MLTKNPQHIFEPNSLACGQAVLAMLFDLDVYEVMKSLNNERETTLKEMLDFSKTQGVKVSSEKIAVKNKSELPNVCVLSLETPRCWHWSLYFKGVFYDPEFGILDDFPQSRRRYYFKVEE